MGTVSVTPFSLRKLSLPQKSLRPSTSAEMPLPAVMRKSPAGAGMTPCAFA